MQGAFTTSPAAFLICSRGASFFDIYTQAPVPERIRLLSQSGPGSVSFISPDTSPAQSVHPEVFCSSLRRAVGLSAVGAVCRSLRACPHLQPDSHGPPPARTPYSPLSDW